MRSLTEPVSGDQLDPTLSEGKLSLESKETSIVLARAQLLWDCRRTLLRIALSGVVISTLIAFLIPSRYDSVTLLMPPDSDNSGAAMLSALVSKGADTIGGYASDLLGIKSSGALFIGILRSRTVEDAIVNKYDLRRVYWVRRMEDARRKLEARTSITEDRKSGMISISVRDRSPQRAQAMAQTYVDQLNIAVSTLSTSSARREREFLETRLGAVKQDLDQAANEFSQFASKNTAIDIPEQGKAMVEAAARLQGQLIAAEAERQGLEQIYSRNNARVRSVQANVDELRRQLNQLSGDAAGASQKDDNSPYPSIKQLPLLGVTYADLYRRTKIEEAVYETLTKQYELAKVQEAKEIPTVKVLDPPSYPERRATPQRKLIVGFATAIVLILGCGWVLLGAAWTELESHDPRKVFAQNLYIGLKHDWEALLRRRSNLHLESWNHHEGK